MKYEWYWVGAITLLALMGFLSLGAKDAALLGWLSLLGGLITTGHVARSGALARKIMDDDEMWDEDVAVHRAFIAVLTTLIIVGIVGIEVAVRKSGGLWGDPWLLIAHLTLATSATIMFVNVRFKHTGVQKPRYHRPLAYGFIAFYTATFVTGTILINEQFKFVVWGTS